MKHHLVSVKLPLLVVICSLALGLTTGCSSSIPEFDQSRAFGFLKQQVDFGPRYPGAPAHMTTADFIVSNLKPYADNVTVQQFTQTIKGKKLDLQNIIAFFNPSAKHCVLLAAHWDTRPIADMEVDPAKVATPIPGANDGASGVAVLLELARVFAKQKPDVGVMMVFFDGEDYATIPPSADTMFLGSIYFAKHLRESTSIDGKPVKLSYGILLDMIGDKDLKIYEEGNSNDSAPEVVDNVWNTAGDLGYGKQFVPSIKYSISDDHLPLIKAGIKCIDVIDFNYGPWHTLDDTVDKCSPESLKVVGDVISHVIYKEKKF